MANSGRTICPLAIVLGFMKDGKSPELQRLGSHELVQIFELSQDTSLRVDVVDEFLRRYPLNTNLASFVHENLYLHHDIKLSLIKEMMMLVDNSSSFDEFYAVCRATDGDDRFAGFRRVAVERMSRLAEDIDNWWVIRMYSKKGSRLFEKALENIVRLASDECSLERVICDARSDTTRAVAIDRLFRFASDFESFRKTLSWATQEYRPIRKRAFEEALAHVGSLDNLLCLMKNYCCSDAEKDLVWNEIMSRADNFADWANVFLHSGNTELEHRAVKIMSTIKMMTNRQLMQQVVLRMKSSPDLWPYKEYAARLMASARSFEAWLWISRNPPEYNQMALAKLSEMVSD